MRPPRTFPPGWKPGWMPSRPGVFYTAVVLAAVAVAAGIAVLIHTATVVRTTSDYAGVVLLAMVMSGIVSMPAGALLNLGATIYSRRDGSSRHRS